jgi:predicted RNA-binding Zn ribbon-like protein
MPRLLGGHVALDFVNTVDPRYGVEPVDHVPDFRAWVEWARYAGVITETEFRRLRSRASGGSADESSAWRRVIRTRDDVHAVLSALVADTAPEPGALQRMGDLAAAAASRRRLTYRAGRMLWVPAEPVTPDDPMLRVVAASCELITTPHRGRLRECPGADGCGWLFLDTSRNGTRKWCSMEVCGNRVKIRHHRRERPSDG